jgi:hypothetical protein
LNNIFEYIFVLTKDLKKYRIHPREIGIPYADKSNIGRYSDSDRRDAGNVWLIPYSRTTGATIKKGHEAPFPVELPYRCIKLTKASNVLDPFVGTGTTLAAARLIGIPGFGYEKYPRKEVIRQKILYNHFIPPEIILLPHLELSIKKYTTLFINDIFHELLMKKSFSFTKKEYGEMQIIHEVLTNLNLNTKLTKDYLEYYKHHYHLKTSDDRRTQLPTYFER